MPIVEDKFHYKKVNKNNFSDIQNIVINDTVKAARNDTIQKVKNIHCRIHNRVPIIRIKGKKLDDFEITIHGCCSLLEQKIQQHIQSKNLNIMGNFKEKAVKFAEKINYRSSSFSDRDYVNTLQYEIDIYKKPQHKISLLTEIIIAIKENLTSHELTCPKEPGTCDFSKRHNSAIFFTEEELYSINATTINLSNQGDKAPYTTQELKDVYSKIDEILEILNKLELGQEIIFSEIEDMKLNATKISKKDFKLLFIGKIAATGYWDLFKNEQIKQFVEGEVSNLLAK